MLRVLHVRAATPRLGKHLLMTTHQDCTEGCGPEAASIFASMCVWHEDTIMVVQDPAHQVGPAHRRQPFLMESQLASLPSSKTGVLRRGEQICDMGKVRNKKGDFYSLFLSRGNTARLLSTSNKLSTLQWSS